MDRRTFVVAVGGTVGLSGCLDGGDRAARTDARTTEDDLGTPVRLTAEGIAGSFRVVDGHQPTDDTASAAFEDRRVTVTGTVDPSGCDRPVLSGLGYQSSEGVADLRIGVESPYGETATVECDNASFDYRCVLTVDTGPLTTLKIHHEHSGTEDRSFVLERS